MDSIRGPDMPAIEQRRLHLEANISRLEESLRYWQVWEAEYEGIKEDFEGLGRNATSEQLLETARNFGGDMINEKEIKSLLYRDGGAQRTTVQILDMISKRIDQGHQNTISIQKQLTESKKRVSDLPSVTLPDMEDESGLPLTEINEELDEDGNVISSVLSEPGKAAPQIVDTLRKAGLKDLDLLSEVPAPEQSKDLSSIPETSPETKNEGKHQETDESIPSTTQKENPSVRKKVSFAEKVEDDGDTSGTDRKITPSSELENENDEDARIRREMMAYGLEEVGAVVAELDLEEGSDSDWDQDGWREDDEDNDDDDDDEDDEDEFGRSLKPQISEAYRRKMQALERKLNVTGLKNIGPGEETGVLVPQLDTTEVPSSRIIGPTKISQDVIPSDGALQRTGDKSVRFADNLDIAPQLDAATKRKDKPSRTKETRAPVVSDTVVERHKTASSQTVTEKPRKMSRFKSEKTKDAGSPVIPPSPPTQNPPPRQPAPPQGHTLSSSLVEHPPKPEEQRPSSPNEFDPTQLKQQVAVEYYKSRNRLIQQQGGFTSNDLSEDQSEGPLMELREDGSTKKVSRFKAARVGKMGS